MARRRTISSQEVIFSFLIELISEVIDTFNVDYKTAVKLLEKVGIWNKRDNIHEMLIWAHYGTDKVIEEIKESLDGKTSSNKINSCKRR